MSVEIDRLDCESRVRQRIGERYGVQLEKRRLVIGRKANGVEVFHEFDGVSPDRQFVMECKTNTLNTAVRPRGRYDSAIKPALLMDLYMLSLAKADKKLLVLTDRPLFDLCIQDMDGLLAPDTQIVFCPAINDG